MKLHLLFYSVLVVGLSLGCTSKPRSQVIEKPQNTEKPTPIQPAPKKEFVLTDDNAIPFFFDYAQKDAADKVRIETQYGNIIIKLHQQTPYHRANFIYLTRKGYFDGTFFHRIVKDFIIQGGNSDQLSTSKKRRAIGKYLLPPDTKNGLRHHRGAVSMPSSEIENPHRLASPYEFFIVQKTPGAYHLDGNYTVFGQVVEGMDVVDIIANLPADKREWPKDNVRMKVVVIPN